MYLKGCLKIQWEQDYRPFFTEKNGKGSLSYFLPAILTSNSLAALCIGLPPVDTNNLASRMLSSNYNAHKELAGPSTMHLSYHYLLQSPDSV